MRLTAKEVSNRLTSSIELLCRHLYPKGKRVGGEWCVGSTDGEEGNSMKIQLTGDSAGLWADFAGSASGDALDLFCVSKGISISEALKEAKRWLGIAETTTGPSRAYSTPKIKGIKPLREGGEEVSEYLTKTRGIPAEVIAKYRVTHKPADRGVVFPSFAPDCKTLIQIKWIGLERDDKGRKRVMTGKDCAPALFGWQAMPSTSRSVIITEGEIDAMSWASWGFPALSVPFGAKNLDWIEYEWEHLERFDEIYLSFDMDEAGREPIRDIVKRLGMHRCKIVKLPKKDANEWLTKYSPAVEEVESVLEDSDVMTPVQFVSPMAYVKDAIRIMKGEHNGVMLSIFGQILRFREGETTVWTGYPGHGKTTLLSQVAVELASKGEKIAVASMEMPIAAQIVKMGHQFYSKDEMTESEIERFAEWMQGRVYPLDVYGMVNPDTLIDLLEYGVRRFGCRHMIVDSIMKLDLKGDDYDLQRIVMNKFTTFSCGNGIHMHVVAHPRKGDSDNRAVGMLDVKGSGDLINQPDNVLSIWRNKRKEMMLSAGRNPSGPDAKIIIEKQRATGVLGEIELRWHGDALQFTTNEEHSKPTQWSQWISSH